MSHCNSEQLDNWLDSWARWVQSEYGISCGGFKSPSFTQDFIQSNQTQHCIILNHEFEEGIDQAVNNLAIKDIKCAEVGRFEYGARRESYDGRYDKPPTIAVKAMRLAAFLIERGIIAPGSIIDKATYSNWLRKFRREMRKHLGLESVVLAA